VNEALGALYRHPRQVLLAWYRYAIYEALVADRSHASYARRAWLDVVSAQYVLFCWPPYARSGWHAAWLQPAELLGMAEQTLQGTADIDAIQHALTRAEALADVAGEPSTSAQYPAWCVFEAALRALRSAWLYRSLEATQPRVDNWAAMVDLDDVSRYAAIAIAGEPATTPTRAQRRDPAEAAAAQLRQTFFWEWWLREAIPRACQRG
jgi:hypothetical protein